MKKDNILYSTKILCEELGIKVNDSTIVKFIENHPNYPSLLSISDFLSYLKVENYTYQVEENDLENIPCPFLCVMNEEESRFSVVKKISDNKIIWYNHNKGWIETTIKSFKSDWSKVVTIFNTEENSGENFYDKTHQDNEIQKKLNVLYFAIVSLSSILICYNYFNYILYNNNTINLYFFSTKLSGFIISLFLIWHLIDKNNPFLNRVCNVSSEVNCHSVLNSKTAYVWKWLSWSEVGFFYFSGGLLLTILNFILVDYFVQNFLFFTSFLSFIYIFYSISLQAFILKKWCLLCLFTQLILFIEFFISAYFFKYSADLAPNIESLTIIFVCYSIPVVFWYPIKKLINYKNQFLDIDKKFNRLKYNPNIFNLLHQEDAIIEELHPINTFEIGRKDAENYLIVVTNPYCYLCASSYKYIQNLCNDFYKEIRCQIVFAASNDTQDIKGLFVRHFFSLPYEIRESALSFWFDMELKDFEVFEKKYPVEKYLEYSYEIIEIHRQWCKNADVKVTPSYFFNGRRLSNIYKIEDFEFLLNLSKDDITFP